MPISITQKLARGNARSGCQPPKRAYPGSTMSSTTTLTAPAIFLAHGAPPLLDDAHWMRELRDWAGVMPRPTSILMISAHWEKNPITLGATQTVPLVYDFYGFSAEVLRDDVPGGRVRHGSRRG